MGPPKIGTRETRKSQECSGSQPQSTARMYQSSAPSASICHPTFHWTKTGPILYIYTDNHCCKDLVPWRTRITKFKGPKKNNHVEEPRNSSDSQGGILPSGLETWSFQHRGIRCGNTGHVTRASRKPTMGTVKLLKPTEGKYTRVRSLTSLHLKHHPRATDVPSL